MQELWKIICITRKVVQATAALLLASVCNAWSFVENVIDPVNGFRHILADRRDGDLNVLTAHLTLSRGQLRSYSHFDKEERE